MRNFSRKDLTKSQKDASSYKEFKENLRALGNKVPRDVGKFPMNMRGWGRKLRYEVSNDSSYGIPTTAHDLRQQRYYNRLDEMGCPEPLLHMN